MSRTINIIMLTVAIAFSGCGSLEPAPNGMLSSRKEIVKDGYGAWLKIQVRDNNTDIQGEFVALDNGKIFILNKDRLSQLSVEKIQSARVIVYKSRSGNNYFYFPKTEWSELSKFSRFPQGLPSGLDASMLKSKPKE